MNVTELFVIWSTFIDRSWFLTVVIKVIHVSYKLPKLPVYILLLCLLETESSSADVLCLVDLVICLLFILWEWVIYAVIAHQWRRLSRAALGFIHAWTYMFICIYMSLG